MLFNFVAFLGLPLGFFGLGQLLWWGLARAMGVPAAQPLWGELGLLGLLGFGNAAILWNFLLPINGAFAWPLLTLGIGVFVFSFLRRGEQRSSLAAIAVPALISAVALAALVGFTPLGYDAGLYHLPAQLWARSGPSVIGLANFHHRFGFNSIIEPISAPFWLQGNLILVGVVDALFLFFYLMAMMQFLREERSSETPVSVAFAVLSPLSLFLLNSYLIFLVAHNDVPAAMVTLTCLFAFIRAHESRDGLSETLTPLSTLFVLALFAIALKLSSLAVAILPAIALLTLLRSGATARRYCVALCLAGAVLVLPTIARGVSLSGCLLYPVAGSCVEALPWSNVEHTEVITPGITSWSRAPQNPAEGATGWAWMPRWWVRVRGLVARLSIVTVVASIAALGLRFAMRRADGPTTNPVPAWTRASMLGGVALFCVASLALWFFGAPDPRFGGAALHVLTLTPGVLIVGSRGGGWRFEPKAWRTIATGGVALAVLFTVEVAVRAWSISPDPGSLLSFRLGTPTVAVVPNQHFGVRPVLGDQCWLTQSPCSHIDAKIAVHTRGRWLLMEPLSRSRGLGQ